MPSRRVTILSATGAAVLVAGLAVGAATIDKAVTLSVDGQASTAHVFGKAVGDLLDNQGIAIASHDRVVPAVGTALHDADR